MRAWYLWLLSPAGVVVLAWALGLLSSRFERDRLSAEKCRELLSAIKNELHESANSISSTCNNPDTHREVLSRVGKIANRAATESGGLLVRCSFLQSLVIEVDQSLDRLERNDCDAANAPNNILCDLLSMCGCTQGKPFKFEKLEKAIKFCGSGLFARTYMRIEETFRFWSDNIKNWISLWLSK